MMLDMVDVRAGNIKTINSTAVLGVYFFGVLQCFDIY